METVKAANQTELAKIRAIFEAQSAEQVKRYEQRLASLREDLELRRKMEIHDLEERKNLHINVLISGHSQDFQKMRMYYNVITRDHLDLIRYLKASSPLDFVLADQMLCSLV